MAGEETYPGERRILARAPHLRHVEGLPEPLARLAEEADIGLISPENRRILDAAIAAACERIRQARRLYGVPDEPATGTGT